MLITNTQKKYGKALISWFVRSKRHTIACRYIWMFSQHMYWNIWALSDVNESLCESFCSTHIASQLDSDLWVKELEIKFVWVQMTYFRESLLSTHTLSLWNSYLRVILVKMTTHHTHHVESMSIWCRYYFDMSKRK